MNFDELKQVLESKDNSADKIRKIETTLSTLVEFLPEQQKEDLHSQFTKDTLGHFVDRIHSVNCMFKMGGEASAEICVGTVTYKVSVIAANSTDEQYKQWKEQANGGKDENIN